MRGHSPLLMHARMHARMRAVTVAALSLASCGHAAVCSGPGACGPTGACIAGRCAPSASEPAELGSTRVVVAPTATAVLCAHCPIGPRDHGDTAAPPGSVPLGQQRLGSVVVLLRFPTPWGNRARIDHAFLTLDPTPASDASAAPVPIRVARILEPWEDATVSWGRQPRLARSELSAFAAAGPPRTLRIDVTALVNRWQRSQPDDHGIALLVDGVDPRGATFDIGPEASTGPRLDVYLR